jgi:uncharacterized membrane protein SpoIIM required for sporulation
VKAAEIIKRREADWAKLESMCGDVLKNKNRENLQYVMEFSSLYRNACADLALASAYQLPPATVEYLHSLVARAHNQLYRGQGFSWAALYKIAFVETPRRIFADPCVHVAGIIFWGLFAIAAYLAYERNSWPEFTNNIVGAEQVEQMETTFASFSGRSWFENMFMAGFYVFNNAGIGLKVFVSMLPILPGLVYLAYNALQLGAAFGHMFHPDAGIAGENFRNFVTAHGPFELTAIILSAGAGLRIGISWLHTDNVRRLDSLQTNARRCIPIALCAVLFFFIAAFIEGFISPAPESVLVWEVKGMVAIFSSGFLMFYFVVLGYPWRQK